MAKKNKLPTQTECLLIEKEVVFTTKGSSFFVSGAVIREALEPFVNMRWGPGLFSRSAYTEAGVGEVDAAKFAREDLEECVKSCEAKNAKAKKAELLLSNIDDDAQYTLNEQETIEIFL